MKINKHLQKLGEVKVEDKDVELNVALHAFIILDKEGIRILERHPTHVISYASSGTEVCFYRTLN